MLVQVGKEYPENGPENIHNLILKSEQRILNLNLFNEVSIALNDTPSHGCRLHVTVIEKWYVWPIPFVEFSDRNFNVWGNFKFDPDRTNYGLYVFNYNLFGRNHTLKTRLKTGYNTMLAIEYRIPFISKHTQWGINTSIAHSSQNEVWYETRNDSLQFYKNGRKNLITETKSYVELTKRLNPFTRIYYGITYEQGQLDTSVPVNDYFVNNLRYQRTYSAYMKLENDTRDNIFYPTYGRYLTLKAGANAWQNNTLEPNIFVSAKAQIFNHLTPKLSSALAIHTELNSNTNAPYSDRQMLGYDELVRGFEHYVIDGTRGLKINTAVRYLVIEKNIKLPFIPIQNYKRLPLQVYLEAYSEGAYSQLINAPPSNQLNNGLIYSTGFGINTLLYNDRLLRLEYSLNSLQEGGFFVHFKKAI